MPLELKKVEELLGITMDSIDKLRDNLEFMNSYNDNLNCQVQMQENEIAKYTSMNFWKRIKWLFSKKI